MDPITAAVELVSRFYSEYGWYIFTLSVGLLTGVYWQGRITNRALEAHRESMVVTARVLGHLKGSTEVLEEHGLIEEAAPRCERYAKENVIDLQTEIATQPTMLDRLWRILSRLR